MVELKEKILYALFIFSLIGYAIAAIIGAITSNSVILDILSGIAVLALISFIMYALYRVWLY